MRIAHIIMSLRCGGIQEIVRIIVRHMNASSHEHVVIAYEGDGQMRDHYEEAGAQVWIEPDNEVISRAIQCRSDVAITYAVNGTRPEEHQHAYDAQRADLPLINFSACSFPCLSPRDLFAATIVPSQVNARLLSWPDVYVIPLPVERPSFEVEQSVLRSELGIAEGSIVIGRCSRLEPSKLVRETLHCMRLVEDRTRKPLHFVLAGAESQWLPNGMRAGQYLGFLRDTAARLDFRSPIVITGSITHGEKWRILSCLDICLAPSLMEGFGFVFVEALSVGAPVVTLDHMANRGTTGPGGLLVYPSRLASSTELVGAVSGEYRLTYGEVLTDSELDALAELTVQLVEDRERRSQLGEAGRDHVTEGKSPNQFSQRIEEVLVQSLGA